MGWVRLSGFDAATSESADDPYIWPEDVLKTGIETYRLLKRFKANCPCACPGGKKTSSGDAESEDAVKKFIIDNLGAGAIFGEMALIGQHMHSSFAQALEDSVLCLMRRDDLQHLLMDKPRVALRILELLGKRLSEAEKKLEDMAFRSVATRLASLLLRLNRDGQDTIDGLSHQELAEMIGTYRETVTQTLNQFKASKLVDIQRKSIRILRPEELAAIASNGS